MWARGSAPAELRPPSYDHIPLCKILHWIFRVVEWQTPTVYPKTDGLRYSLPFNHNSYSYPPILLVLYIPSCAAGCGGSQALECGAYDLSRRTPRPLAISVHSQRATFRR